MNMTRNTIARIFAAASVAIVIGAFAAIWLYFHRNAVAYCSAHPSAQNLYECQNLQGYDQ